MDEEPKIDTETPEPASSEIPSATDIAAADETPSAESAAAEPAAAAAPAAAAPLTAERIFDITLGVAVLAGEVIDRSARNLTEQAKNIQQQAPEFLARAEERGRPLRQNLFGIYGEDGESGSAAPRPAAAEGGEGATAAAPGSAAGGGLAESLRSLGSSLGFIGGATAARQSAEDEIRTLEGRVRELEQVVASGKTGLSDETAAAEAAETMADAATYVPGEPDDDESLADSPYAVSETDEEQAAEGAKPAKPRASRKKASDAEGKPEA